MKLDFDRENNRRRRRRMNANRGNLNNLFEVISLSTESLTDSDMSDFDNLSDGSNNNSEDGDVDVDGDGSGGDEAALEDDGNWETEEEIEEDN